jgi:hypothetical protein
LLLAMEGPEVRADCPVDIRLSLGGNLVTIVVANIPMRVRNFLNRATILAIGRSGA